jgi:hypothetical protein
MITKLNTPNFSDTAWIWEECAPSYSDMQMQEGKENTVNLVCCITQKPLWQGPTILLAK